MIEELVAYLENLRPLLRDMAYDQADVDISNMDLSTATSTFLRASMYFAKHYKDYELSPPKENVPVGCWYVVTLTVPDKEPRSALNTVYGKAMEFFQERNIDVYLSSIEHSNIWHAHLLVCARNYAKNMSRDLTKFVGYRAQVERKISNARRFNGACNYITKRGYPDDTTHVELIEEKLEYIHKKGWCLKE